MEAADLPLEAEPKGHLTAVVLIPPEAAWEPIQAIRRVHDPQIRRWMPHVTLLYPFVAERRLAEAAERLRPVAASVAAFEVTLAGFGHFVHGARSATLWLRPEPTEAVRRLQAALEAAMPWCDDVSRFAGGYTPHLSVGRFGDRGALRRTAGALEAGWEPLRFVAEDVALLARPGAPDQPFAVRARLPLKRPGTS